jgi:TonB family protein
MKRPPAALVLAVALGACQGAPSPSPAPSPPPRAPAGGTGGAPVAAPATERPGKPIVESSPEPRGTPAPEADDSAADDPDEESSEGNGSGFSRGAGGLGDTRSMPPFILPGPASVHGSLDKELVRRILWRHFDEVRYCYERELVRKRTLRGRVVVDFTISAQGQVLTSRLRRSTLHTPRAESCLVAAVRGWEFPKPLGGDVVSVSYPFHFMPGGADYVPVVPAAPPAPR